MNPKDAIFIVDPYTEGHHDFYNSLLIDGLLARGSQVFFLTSADILHRESYQRYKTMEPNLQVIILKDRPKGGRGAMPWRFQDIHEYVERYQPQHIYLQLIDAMLYTTLYSYLRHGVAYNASWSALYIQPKYQIWTNGNPSELYHKRVLRLKEWIRFRMLKALIQDRNLVRIDMIDEFAVEHYNRCLKREVCHLQPDPVPDIFFSRDYDMASLRTRMGFAKDDLIFLGYGFHSDRKGSHHLLNAFLEIATSPACRNAKLLLVGPVASNALLQTLQSERSKKLQKIGRLKIVDRHLSQEESLPYFRISNCVCVPYINHIGTSGVLLRALVLGKQVIASNQNWMGRLLTKYELGISCEQDSQQSLAEAMSSACSRKHLTISFPDSDFYRADHFVAGLLQILS